MDYTMTRRAAAAGSICAAVAWPQAARARQRFSFDRRLRELGLDLPDPPEPVATYAPFRRVSRTLYLAGLGPAQQDTPPKFGRVGANLTIEEGYRAARAAGLSVLALLRNACGGSLDRVRQCVRVDGYVASADTFHAQPQVMNGASDLFVEVFGEAGLHARCAVGVNALPFNIPVEVATVWELR